MEKPHLVGGSEDEQRMVRRNFNREKELFPLGYAEVPLSTDQKIFIESVLASLPGFLEKYGIENNVSLTNDRIHYIDRSKLSEEDRMKFSHPAYFDRVRNRIYVFSDDVETLAKFLIAITHEVFHAISFESYSIRSLGKDIGATDRRFGLEMKVESNQGKIEDYFRTLNEAVTDRLAEQFIKNLADNTNSRIGISNPDNFVSPTYTQEKEDLDHLVNDLYEKNKDLYESREEVFALFARSTMGGAVLPLARLIEKTYGKGWFRKIGEMTK